MSKIRDNVAPASKYYRLSREKLEDHAVELTNKLLDAQMQLDRLKYQTGTNQMSPRELEDFLLCGFVDVVLPIRPADAIYRDTRGRDIRRVPDRTRADIVRWLDCDEPLGGGRDHIMVHMPEDGIGYPEVGNPRSPFEREMMERSGVRIRTIQFNRFAIGDRRIIGHRWFAAFCRETGELIMGSKTFSDRRYVE